MKKTHIVGLIMVALSIAAIVIFSADFSTYESFNSAAEKDGDKEYQVIGELVKSEELYYNPVEDPNYFSFFMKDEEGTMRKVEFTGAKPQDFERSEEVVVTGKMAGDVFQASKILMKCPSKYVDDEIKLDGVDYKEVTAENT